MTASPLPSSESPIFESADVITLPTVHRDRDVAQSIDRRVDIDSHAPHNAHEQVRYAASTFVEFATEVISEFAKPWSLAVH